MLVYKQSVRKEKGNEFESLAYAYYSSFKWQNQDSILDNIESLLLHYDERNQNEYQVFLKVGKIFNIIDIYNIKIKGSEHILFITYFRKDT